MSSLSIKTLACALSLSLSIVYLSYCTYLSNRHPQQELVANSPSFETNRENGNDSDYFFIHQIGFGKMGCTSLGHFFKTNRMAIMKQYHWTKPIIESQTRNGKPSLGNLTNQYRYFGDFGAAHLRPNLNLSHSYLFEDILYFYPNSKFILNIRDLNAWLKSRYLHYSPHSKSWMLDYIAGAPSLEQSYNKYLCYVIDYFYNHKSIRDDLLVFDIGTDSIAKVITYFERFNLRLNASVWGNANARANKGYVKEAFYQKRVAKYHRYTRRHPKYIIQNGSNTYDYLRRICSVAANVTYYQ